MPSITKESDGRNPSRDTLTVERLKELLHYDPATGVFTWRVSRGKVKAGSPAGYPSLGYIKIKIDGKNHQAHRLAWFYMTDSWPEDEIDHRDLSKANNRWGNLRPATHAQNLANIPALKNNKSGSKGVIARKGKWVARIRVCGKQIWLGTHDSQSAAAAAYAAAAREHHGDFARVA
jgi:hypothetical protein